MDPNKFLAIETELEYIIDWTKKLGFPFLAADWINSEREIFWNNAIASAEKSFIHFRFPF